MAELQWHIWLVRTFLNRQVSLIAMRPLQLPAVWTSLNLWLVQTTGTENPKEHGIRALHIQSANGTKLPKKNPQSPSEKSTNKKQLFFNENEIMEQIIILDGWKSFFKIFINKKLHSTSAQRSMFVMTCLTFWQVVPQAASEAESEWWFSLSWMEN